jgi:RNA polymerase sigma factor (TIGR02999 family)
MTERTLVVSHETDYDFAILSGDHVQPTAWELYSQTAGRNENLRKRVLVSATEVGVVSDSSKQVTELLADWSRGDLQAREALMPLVYDELRRLAASYLRRERPDHTLQATALVNEAYLRLVEEKSVNWQSKSHFFGVSAKLMRRILVDHARSHLAEKRGSGMPKMGLTEAIVMSQEQPADLLALDESLTHLAVLDPQQGRIVELRVFVGLTVEETAQVLNISPATVKRDWAVAKAWLLREVHKARPS